MERYHCYQSVNEGSIIFIRAEQDYTGLPSDAVLKYTVDAPDYNSAMQQHYDRQGWGLYNAL